MEDKQKIPLKNEIYRKLIHLVAIVIPLIYLFISKPLMVLLSGLFMLSMIELDVLKQKYKKVATLYNKYLGDVLRYSERDFKKRKFTGGTYLSIGIFITVLFFQKNIAISAITIMIIADSLSAIVGKSIGKIKIFNKTLEGTFVFLATGVLLILFVLPRISNSMEELYSALIAMVLCTILDVIPFNVDDNVLIPVSFAFFYSLFFSLLT